jgi:hypothetical protein
MRSGELLTDAVSRIREAVDQVVDRLTPDQLGWRADDGAAFGVEQVWTTRRWVDRFALPFETPATGYGHSSGEVARVRPDGELLIGYHHDVADLSVELIRTVSDDDLNLVVDERWDPPVTLGVRLISVINDGMQHVGQAAYVRGLLERLPQ